MKRIRTRGFGVVAATLMLAGTFYAAAPASASAKVNLVLWQNYGTEQNAVATTNLVKAFEKLNPNITIKVVAQPGTNYFQLLQSAAISGNGPDLAVMWTGIFDLQYSSYLENMKGNVPAADLAKIENLQWEAPNYDTSQGALRDAAGDPVLHWLLQQGAVQEGGYHFGTHGLEHSFRRLQVAQGQGHPAPRLRQRRPGDQHRVLPLVRHRAT